MFRSKIAWSLGFIGLTFSCSGRSGSGSVAPSSSAGPSPSAATATVSSVTPSKPEAVAVQPLALEQHYQRHLEEFRDLSRTQLFERFTVHRRHLQTLAFDPKTANYYAKAAQALELTPDEQALYQANGFAVIDHGQPYSMGSLYHAIYTRDLPVFVTTDSILHALHRSFDQLVMQLEQGRLMDGYEQSFRTLHERVATEFTLTKEPRLLVTYQDIDVYLAVARNLFAGAGAPAGAPSQNDGAPARPGASEQWDGTLLVPSVTGQNEAVLQLLRKIQELKTETPDRRCTRLRNQPHCIDYSQFIPRGHYTKTGELQRYFRAMMWLGRADMGWNLTVSKSVGEDAMRELRGAALLSLVARNAGELPRLQAMANVIELLVGPPDSATLFQLADVLGRLGLEKAAQLVPDEALDRLAKTVTNAQIGGQAIRSEGLAPAKDGQPATPPPQILQLVGQRFIVDAFILSKVVYDSIDYQGKKVKRMLPTGLDVWAALGNDEAAHLLIPELERHHYAPQLFSARSALPRAEAGFWTQSLYASWLNALRTLTTVVDSSHFPSVMRSQVWQKKQLQTQLASWAELRHDTVLYAKQSYSASLACEYPMGYVEPYPEFYASLKRLATTTAERFEVALRLLPSPTENARAAPESEFLRKFAGHMGTLELLANKELAGEPFTIAEQSFLKKTIDIRGGGSGPPRYDGWYAELFFGTRPNDWAPTIADVHTSPGPLIPGVLEEGVGSARFIMVAIDNGADRAVYVGPVYSYYEFVVPPDKRLTDEEWSRLLELGAAVAPPRWTAAFAGPTKRRELQRAAKPNH